MPMYKDLPKAIKRFGYPDPKRKIAEVGDNLLKLRQGLNEEIPSLSHKDKLHIATFNIRHFGSTIGTYTRSSKSLYYLAEIIAAFDVVAIQEIMNEGNGDFQTLMGILGKDFDYCMTPTKKADEFPYAERMAFVYNKWRVRLTGNAHLTKMPNDDYLVLNRNPYTVRFQAGWFKFELHSVHLTFGGGNPRQRIAECEALARYFGTRNPTEYTLILMGDFNTPDLDCEGLRILQDVGFRIPSPLTERIGSNAAKSKCYDHILYRPTGNDVKCFGGGVFDYYRHVFTEASRERYLDDYRLTKKDADVDAFKKEFEVWKTYQMSDHLPVWMGVDINYADDFLQSFTQN